MRRLWPKSLAGQLILLLLLALVAAQAIGAFIFWGERRHAIRSVTHELVLVRTASVVRLLMQTPAEIHPDILRSVNTRNLHFSLDDKNAVEIASFPGASARLSGELQEMIGPAAREVWVKIVDSPWRPFAGHHESDRRREWEEDDDDDEIEGDHEWTGRDRDHDHGKHWRRGRRLGLEISVLLPSERWLNVATAVPLRRPWAWSSFVSLLLLAALVIVVVVLTVRRLTRPLKRLAVAAEGLGRGETVGDLPEAGPAEVRQTTRAFNLMRGRLERYIGDRTRMLAAISHDLRTPITSLRLRAEFVEDAETKAKILQTLDEMQRMTDEVLAFIREDAAREESRQVDLAALIESLCQDLQDLGLAVEVAEAPRTPYPCRPVALKRALRNLIENAVRYGQRAHVALQETDEDHVIVVEDEGPGIPEAERERVFEPFVRLDESRSVETGGIGLGLAIARSIVRGHGGDIALEDRAEGGLRVKVRLPKAPR